MAESFLLVLWYDNMIQGSLDIFCYRPGISTSPGSSGYFSWKHCFKTTVRVFECSRRGTELVIVSEPLIELRKFIFSLLFLPLSDHTSWVQTAISYSKLGLQVFYLTSVLHIYIFFFLYQESWFSVILGMVEIEYHIIIHLHFPIIHSQQSQNNQTNAVTSSMTV